MTDKLWFSSPDAALAAYDKSGSKIFWKILNAYDARKFTGDEHKILPLIEKEAGQGDSSAQRALAEAFLYGRGKPEDIEQAIFWLEKAIEPKDRILPIRERKPRFLSCIALEEDEEFYDSIPKTSNLKSGKRDYQDKKAFYLLAGIREKAVGEEKIREAVRLYVASSSRGCIESYYELGRICEAGLGVTRNLPAAVYWYRRASTGGGIGSSRVFDVKSKNAYERIIKQMGEDTWETAVDNNFSHIMSLETFLYTWLLAETGIAEHQYKLGELYAVGLWAPKDSMAGVNWLEKAVEQGYFRAYYQLGMSYYLGEGVEKDFGKAAELFRKGAELEHNEACHALGYLYQEGKGVPKNIELARHWYHKALEANFPPNDHSEDRGYEKAEDSLKNLFYPSLTRDESTPNELRR